MKKSNELKQITIIKYVTESKTDRKKDIWAGEDDDEPGNEEIAMKTQT